MRGDGSAAVSPWADISNTTSSEVKKPNSAMTTLVVLREHLDRFPSSSSISRVKQLPYSSS